MEQAQSGTPADRSSTPSGPAGGQSPGLGMILKVMGPGHILLAVLGVLLVVLAILLPTVVVPGQKQLPAEIDATAFYEGTATVLDTKTFQPVPDLPVTVVRHYESVESDDGGVLVLDRFVANGIVGQPFTAPATGVFAVDRKTGQHVSGNGADKERSGQAIGFPFGVEQRAYDFWDETIGQTLTAEFEGEDTYEGLDVYKFRLATTEPIKIGEREVPGAALGASGTVTLDITYARDSQMLVEKTTGSPVFGSDHNVIALAKPGTTEPLAVVNDTTAQQTKASSMATVDAIKAGLGLLNIASVWAPIVLALLGLLLVFLSFGPVRKVRKAMHA